MISRKIMTTHLFLQEHRKWRWANRHPWQSWRDHYYKNKEWFDSKILRYQKKHGLVANEPRKAISSARQKRTREDRSSSKEDVEQVGSEVDRKRKRQRVEEGQRRAKVERERREALKEEEEEEESQGEGTSRGAFGGRIMRNKPSSPEKRVQEKSRVANAKVEIFSDGNRNKSSDGGDDEDEEEVNQESMGPDDYEGGIFGSTEDEAEETEVIELTDAQSDNEAEKDVEEVDEQLIIASRSESTTSSEK